LTDADEPLVLPEVAPGAPAPVLLLIETAEVGVNMPAVTPPSALEKEDDPTGVVVVKVTGLVVADAEFVRPPTLDR
jgi:hypothetical protein